jgi:hypothetical protein
MARKSALIGSIDVDTWSLTMQVVASPLRTITLTNGETWATDLLAELETKATAFGELAAVRFEFVDGCAKVTLPANCTLSWTVTALRDALRFTGATMVATSTATRQMRGVFAPTAPLIDDRPKLVASGSVVLSTTSADVHHYGTRPHRLIGVRFAGHQRSGVYDEWRSFKDFWDDYLGPGAEVLLYPDLTIADAFDATDHPWGWTAIRVISPREFDPAFIVPSYYGLWRWDFEAVET